MPDVFVQLIATGAGYYLLSALFLPLSCAFPAQDFFCAARPPSRGAFSLPSHHDPVPMTHFRNWHAVLVVA